MIATEGEDKMLYDSYLTQPSKRNNDTTPDKTSKSASSVNTSRNTANLTLYRGGVLIL